MSAFSEKERCKIAHLQEIVGKSLSPRLSDDFSLFRWLKQNKMDPDTTANRLKHHMVYRNYLDLDREDDSTFELNPVLEKSLPFCWTGGRDRFGSPIAIRMVGRVDIQGNLRSVRTSDYMRHEMYQSERVMRKIRPMETELNRLVGMCVLIDLEGFHFDPFVLGLLSTYFARLEEVIVHQNFPLIDERIVIINAPRLFASICGILNKLWPSIKIHMFGANYQERIFEIIDPSELPERFGGTKSELDLETPLVLPEKVPKEVCYEPSNDPIPLTKIQIRAKKRIRLISQIELPLNSKIRWFFKGDHDIAFALFWSKEMHLTTTSPNSKSDEGVGDDTEMLLVPKYRSKTDLIPDHGEIAVITKGLYVAEFCNHHSMLTTKTVQVYLEFRAPNGKKIEFKEIELS